jgi:hypothetical protein
MLIIVRQLGRRLQPGPAPGFPAAGGPEPRPMSPHDYGRLNDSGQTEQTWPQPVYHTSKRAITALQPGDVLSL